MNLQIETVGGSIVCVKDFKEPLSRGEIAQFYVELTIARKVLLQMWEDYEEN